MIDLTALKTVFGILLIVASVYDAWKYIWQSQSIRRVGLAKGHSRKFLGVAFINDVVKLLYGVIIFDVFIILSSLLAMVTVGYNFYTVYLFYPYRHRGLSHFKRPNLFTFIVNASIPNNFRKRL